MDQGDDLLEARCGKEIGMGVNLRELALRLKVIEILGRYHRAKRQLYVMRQWKRALIHPN